MFGDGVWTLFGREYMSIDPPENLSPDRTRFDYDHWPLWSSDFRLKKREWLQSDAIFQWWTAAHDDLLRAEIERSGWAWSTPTKELARITEKHILDEFKATHPKCVGGQPWYNVLNLFAVARVEEGGLLADIEKPRWVSCILCGRLLHQSNSHFLRSRDLAFFCRPCMNEGWGADAESTRESALIYLRDLAEVIERVPHARFGDKTADYAGLSLEQAVKILRLRRSGPSARSITSLFGSWFLGLVEAGILADGSQRTNRGIRTVASDGHMCSSLGERTICDLFHRYGIHHDREVRYPGAKAFRADWEVNGVFVEYLGLTGVPEYDAKSLEKERIASVHGKQLIKIYPTDLVMRNRLLRKLGPILGIAVVRDELGHEAGFQ
jgi:hypothetical protein